MQQTNVITILVKIIESTPLYVWGFLIFLIHRGIKMSKEVPVDIKKSFTIPVIFIVWGIYSIYTEFPNIMVNFLFYFVFRIMGTYIGFKLYKKFRKIYFRNNILYKSSCTLPLFTMIINFLVKYILNVLIAVKPGIVQNSIFTVVYSSISGISTGLFFGNILFTYLGMKKLLN